MEHALLLLQHEATEGGSIACRALSYAPYARHLVDLLRGISDLYICQVICGVDLGSELEGRGELMQERLVLLEVDGRQMVDSLGEEAVTAYFTEDIADDILGVALIAAAEAETQYGRDEVYDGE